MTRLHRLCLCLITLLFCFPVKAEPPPVPKNKTEILDSFKKRIEQESEEKKSLEKKAKTIHADLSKTKNNLIDVATSIQKNEKNLKKFEQRIRRLEEKKSTLNDDLQADRASIARLILALERIRRTPPEAMIARPDSAYETAQSALLMGRIIPSVNRHAKKLNKNLETLDRVTKELDIEKEALSKTSKDLKERHAALSDLMAKREKLYKETNDNIKAHKISIQKISLEAKNLEDLVKKIKENERKEAEQRKKTKRWSPSNPFQEMTDTGGSRLPISGIIRTGYKQKDDLNAQSKGITIEGRPGGLVIAPMGGKIQFTGTFKRYGNIVIIEHKDNYHSLVSGLDKINSVVGTHVKSGEPIGILPNSSLIPRPTLYYELRKNGKPVNPSVKFPDLG